MHYYDQTQLLAQVDTEDNIIGKVEKWEAHEKGILHRAYTICLLYQGKLLLQHRRHPVFDGVVDLACSSHPVYIEDQLEDIVQSAKKTLIREWDINDDMLVGELVDKGSIYYQAKDPLSTYQEHEVCHLVLGELSSLPHLNSEYSYGYMLVEKSKLDQEEFAINKAFAPWIKPLIKLL